jgi:hypothetical protein
MVSSIDLTISGSRPLGCFSITAALGGSGIIGGIIYSSTGLSIDFNRLVMYYLLFRSLSLTI